MVKLKSRLEIVNKFISEGAAIQNNLWHVNIGHRPPAKTSQTSAWFLKSSSGEQYISYPGRRRGSSNEMLNQGMTDQSTIESQTIWAQINIACSRTHPTLSPWETMLEFSVAFLRISPCLLSNALYVWCTPCNINVMWLNQTKNIGKGI